MDSAVLTSVMDTVAGNVKTAARRQGTDASVASNVTGMMREAVRELNEGGAFEKLPEEVRIHFIADVVQDVAITALTAKDMDIAKLKANVEQEISGSKALQAVQEKAAAQQVGGGIQRGADGRRRIKTPGDTSFAGSYGGTE